MVISNQLLDSKTRYKIPDRLSDVIALIQVLALDEKARRSENGLTKEIRAKPLTANIWTDIAQEHQEFFRVRPEKDNKPVEKQSRISLIARFVSPKDEEGIRPPLKTELVWKMVETAQELQRFQHESDIAELSRNVAMRGIIFGALTGTLFSNLVVWFFR